MRHFLNLFDVSTGEIKEILEIAVLLKEKLQRGIREPLLAGRVLGLLFEKPSLRTRVSFQAAMTHLGGSSMFLGQDVGWGDREPVADFGRVLSEYLDILVVRSFGHERLEELASFCTCPIINGLTDSFHPCQALADYLTLHELEKTGAGSRLAYIGDGNNVAVSLALMCSRMGLEFAIATPEKYTMDAGFVSRLAKEIPGAKIFQTRDPLEAAAGAVAVYTDTWTSMGQEAEKAQRLKDFDGFQVTSEVMAEAAPDAAFLHCMPAHRGEEVPVEVIDGPQSSIIRQAANRMNIQKAIIVWLLEQDQ